MKKKYTTKNTKILLKAIELDKKPKKKSDGVATTSSDTSDSNSRVFPARNHD